MKKGLKISFALVITLALLGLPLTVAGCGGGSGKYTAVTTTFSGASISYEYPDGYQMPPGGPGNTSITYMRFLGGQVEQYNADVMIFIETANLTPGHTESDQMDSDVASIMQSTQNFRLIKRATTKVLGYNAQLLAFTATFVDTPLTSTTTTTWVTYVERDGKVWELGAMANSDIGDTAQTVHNHLVDTFKFQ
jgi:hypothetical protein